MKTWIISIVAPLTFYAFANVTSFGMTESSRRKQKEEEELAKHLVFMEELEKQAEAAGEKRFVPPPPPEPPTRQQEEHYTGLVRKWVNRLWLPHDCYVMKSSSKGINGKIEWTHHTGVWSNEFMKSQVYTSRQPKSESMPWDRIESRFAFDIADQQKSCYFEFLNDGTDTINNFRNELYRYPNVYYNTNNYKPIHTNEREARLKAAEYAAMFGVSNLWDSTKFECRTTGFFFGVWEFNFTPVVNGYPTLYAVGIRIADLPGYPVGKWFNCLYQIPTNLTTKVVLTAEEGKRKGVEYLKKYFPLKDITPRLTFHNNRLEYITPNYNYIRPEDETGFSEYQPKHDEVALVWANTFKKPEGEGFPWVVIYVDAATGEMLGGSD